MFKQAKCNQNRSAQLRLASDLLVEPETTRSSDLWVKSPTLSNSRIFWQVLTRFVSS